MNFTHGIRTSPCYRVNLDAGHQQNSYGSLEYSCQRNVAFTTVWAIGPVRNGSTMLLQQHTKGYASSLVSLENEQ